MSFWGFRDYLPVTQRRANAAKEVEKLKHAVARPAKTGRAQ